MSAQVARPCRPGRRCRPRPSTRRCRSPRRARDAGVLATAALVRFGFGLADGDGLPSRSSPSRWSSLGLRRAAAGRSAVRRRCTRWRCRAASPGRNACMTQAEAMAVAHDSPVAGARGAGRPRRPVGRSRRCRPADGAGDRAARRCAPPTSSGDPTLVVAALHSVFRADPRARRPRRAGVRARAPRRRGDRVAVPVRRAAGRSARRVAAPSPAVSSTASRSASQQSRRPAARSGWCRSAGTTRLPALPCWRSSEAQFEAVARLAGPPHEGEPGVEGGARPSLWPSPGRLTEAVDARPRGPGSGRATAMATASWRGDDRLVATVLAAEVAVLTGDGELARSAASAQLATRRDGSPWSPTPPSRSARSTGCSASWPYLDGRHRLAVAATSEPPSRSPSQAPLWRTRSQLGLATALRARGGPGDAAEASRLFDSARLSTSRAQTQGSAWLERGSCIGRLASTLDLNMRVGGTAM